MAIALEMLKPSAGSRKKSMRLGRGEGKKGKTCGRGQKGQKARSGGKIRRGFEGGQNPLSRRVPKRGFKSLNQIKRAEINVGDLNIFENGQDVDINVLKTKKIIPKNIKKLIILGNGDININLSVIADRFSESAKNKIIAAGGKITEVV